jgi:hypothetical protein
MSEHFLLSPTAKTLSPARVFRMSDAELEAEFRRVRRPENNGDPVCPHCGGIDIPRFRNPCARSRRALSRKPSSVHYSHIEHPSANCATAL